MTKKVLCAVDDTEHSKSAVAWRRPRVRNSLFLL
jgi:hypothetical protein